MFGPLEDGWGSRPFDEFFKALFASFLFHSEDAYKEMEREIEKVLAFLLSVLIFRGAKRPQNLAKSK